MKEYPAVLKRCPLFVNIMESELEALLKCLGARFVSYRKEEFIFQAGERPRYVGVVLSGSVHVITEDYWGNRMIMTAIEPGYLFGEAFSCANVAALPVSAVAHTPAEILLLDYQKIVTTCSSACSFHNMLIQNMMMVLASKNIFLTQKIAHITKKTTRDKVLSFLSEQALRAGRATFEIAFNRQELADYLAVERSALSGTLSKMQTEGLITYHKNRFTLSQGVPESE